jgi:hypothetical protein
MTCHGRQELAGDAATRYSRALEADRTNTFLADVCAFDATSNRELHTRTQNRSALSLAIPEYQSSALARTMINI